MTQLKPRRLDKLRKSISAVDKAFVDRSDLNDSTKIKELENQMDSEIFDGKRNIGLNSQKNFVKRIKKSHKNLR